nr:flagellar hook-basal body protein [Lachnospiraceae bacterium]
AIDGKGFFAIKTPNGTRYTRNGNFTWSINGANIELTDTEGNQVMDTNMKAIRLPAGCVSNLITIAQDGQIYYPDAENNLQSMGMTIGLYQFQNPAGLHKNSSSLYEVTDASGQAINEATTNLQIQKSGIRQGYLEGSNVQVVDEMVNLIVAQRAYEMNSKIITASDEMMQQANNLRG